MTGASSSACAAIQPDSSQAGARRVDRATRGK
jgi:hypothetical protein